MKKASFLSWTPTRHEPCKPGTNCVTRPCCLSWNGGISTYLQTSTVGTTRALTANEGVAVRVGVVVLVVGGAVVVGVGVGVAVGVGAVVVG